MLEMDVDVMKGIMFIRLGGDLNAYTFHDFEQQLNYLLYKQGMHYYVFNFFDLNCIDQSILSHLQNKLVEIFLSCGKVAMCGFQKFSKHLFGSSDNQEKLFYINDEVEAFQYLSI